VQKYYEIPTDVHVTWIKGAVSVGRFSFDSDFTTTFHVEENALNEFNMTRTKDDCKDIGV
jgi:hypothetical protein